jgi:large subunit ribosomal protein L31
MKKGIHPEYYMTKFTDISSGKVFVIGSTVESVEVEISSASHPAYTGQEIVIDTENKVEDFKKKVEEKKKYANTVENKKKKREERKRGRVDKIEAKNALTLRDMLKGM